MKFTGKWIDQETIILSEVAQIQKHIFFLNLRMLALNLQICVFYLGYNESGVIWMKMALICSYI